MRIEREIMLSVLKLTRTGAIQKEFVAQDTRTPVSVADEVLGKLCQQNLIDLNGNIITTAANQKLALAIAAINEGADAQRTCRFLEWKEFEHMAATAFEANGYNVKRNFHFKNPTTGKRWEIDLVACRQPHIVCVDCKHWQHGWSRGAIEKAVEAQVERTRALAESLQDFSDKLKLNKWIKAILFPVVLALNANPLRTLDDTPIVSVLQVQDFINKLPAQSVLLTHFSTILKRESRKLSEF